MGSASRRTIGRLRGRIEPLRRKYSGSAAEQLAKRLVAVDVINRGILFAAVLLLGFIPFLIVIDALSGRSTVVALSRRLFLDHRAATDVSRLLAPAASVAHSLTAAGWIFFIIGGIAAASALQGLYEAVFELKPRGARDVHRQLVWLGLFICASLLVGWGEPGVRSAGGPVPLGLLGLVAAGLFWWLSMWVLVGGRVGWRALFPAAAATALFWVGMEIVFAFSFSGMVISNQKHYGPIGVIFALMTWLIAIGVVVILGAGVGVVWRERRLSAGTGVHDQAVTGATREPVRDAAGASHTTSGTVPGTDGGAT